MKDKVLDKKLDIARDQADRFFNKYDFDRNKKIVFSQIDRTPNIEPRNRGCMLKKVPFIGFVATLAILLLAVGINHRIRCNRAGNGPITPIFQQSVGIAGERDSHMLNYFRIDNPNHSNNLLAILWQRDSRGGYSAVYSSVMEDAYIPDPVAIITIPSNDSNFALVSSSSRDGDFIHYRLIRYTNGIVTVYLERNFVPRGRVVINNGMVVEERLVPPDYSPLENDNKIPKPGKMYRYYIPVALKDDGSYILTANRVRIEKGATLTLFTDTYSELPKIEYDGKVLNKNGGCQPEGIIGPSIDFTAQNEGLANLKIDHNVDSKEPSVLRIEVVSP